MRRHRGGHDFLVGAAHTTPTRASISPPTTTNQGKDQTMEENQEQRDKAAREVELLDENEGGPGVALPITGKNAEALEMLALAVTAQKGSPFLFLPLLRAVNASHALNAVLPIEPTTAREAADESDAADEDEEEGLFPSIKRAIDTAEDDLTVALIEDDDSPSESSTISRLIDSTHATLKWLAVNVADEMAKRGQWNANLVDTAEARLEIALDRLKADITRHVKCALAGILAEVEAQEALMEEDAALDK